MKIGVLALQGAFIEHEKMLAQLDVECFEIRNKKDLNKAMDGLIIPGGESTVIGKLLEDLDMMESIRRMIDNGLPVLATCAGMILLAKNITGQDNAYLATMPITVKRNAYGRQLGSFVSETDIKGIGNMKLRFIRAPYVESFVPEVEVLGTVQNKIIAVKYKNQIAVSFHPELTDDCRIHRQFIQLIKNI